MSWSPVTITQRVDRFLPTPITLLTEKYFHAFVRLVNVRRIDALLVEQMHKGEDGDSKNIKPGSKVSENTKSSESKSISYPYPPLHCPLKLNTQCKFLQIKGLNKGQVTSFVVLHEALLLQLSQQYLKEFIPLAKMILCIKEIILQRVQNDLCLPAWFSSESVRKIGANRLCIKGKWLRTERRSHRSRAPQRQLQAQRLLTKQIQSRAVSSPFQGEQWSQQSISTADRIGEAEMSETVRYQALILEEALSDPAIRQRKKGLSNQKMKGSFKIKERVKVEPKPHKARISQCTISPFNRILNPSGSNKQSPLASTIKNLQFASMSGNKVVPKIPYQTLRSPKRTDLHSKRIQIGSTSLSNSEHDPYGLAPSSVRVSVQPQKNVRDIEIKLQRSSAQANNSKYSNNPKIMNSSPLSSSKIAFSPSGATGSKHWSTGLNTYKNYTQTEGSNIKDNQKDIKVNEFTLESAKNYNNQRCQTEIDPQIVGSQRRLKTERGQKIEKVSKRKRSIGSSKGSNTVLSQSKR